MMANGSLVLVDARGKTHLHFRRKDNDAWQDLYETLAGIVPASALSASTKGTPLIHEDIDDWHDRKIEEIERRRSD